MTQTIMEPDALTQDDLCRWAGVKASDCPAEAWDIEVDHDGAATVVARVFGGLDCNGWVRTRVLDAEGRLRRYTVEVPLARDRTALVAWLEANDVPADEVAAHGSRIIPSDPPFVMARRFVTDGPRRLVFGNEVFTEDRAYRLRYLPPAEDIPTQ